MNEPAARSLEYWASVQGGAAALIEDDSVLTWADWNDYANLLAQTLERRGIGANDVVGVRMRTRTEWAVIAAAIAKVGARLLSIDRRFSAMAVRDVMIDSGAVALFVDDRRPGAQGDALFALPMRLRASLDADAPGFMPFRDLFPPVAAPRYAAGSPPLSVYTSAERGRLYGLALPRRHAAAASRAPAPRADTGASLISVCLTSMVGYRQVQAALSQGRRMVFLRRFSPRAALEAIARHRVTEWTLSTTSCLRMAEIAPGLLSAIDLSSLKQVSAVTGPIDRRSKARLVQALGPVLFESYAGISTGPITALPPEARSMKPESYGRPVPGAAIEIRDRTGHALPANQHGDIWARTPMTMGVNGPHGPFNPGHRDIRGFLRVGDIGRLDEDGYLYVAGPSEDAAPRHPDAGARVYARSRLNS